MTPRLLALAALLLVACTSTPPPDWKTNAVALTSLALQSYLDGNTQVAETEFKRAREQVARTGRPEVVATAELIRCAAQVASLVFEPCAAFEKLRAEAGPAERAYADYLAGRLSPEQASLLPAAQRPFAAGSLEGPAAVAALREVEDPLSRLVAAGVLFQRGRADPQAVALAVETASAQGWRRPLLAWLMVQLALAERAGDAAEIRRVKQRIDIVGGKA